MARAATPGVPAQRSGGPPSSSWSRPRPPPSSAIAPSASDNRRLDRARRAATTRGTREATRRDEDGARGGTGSRRLDDGRGLLRVGTAAAGGRAGACAERAGGTEDRDRARHAGGARSEEPVQRAGGGQGGGGGRGRL